MSEKQSKNDARSDEEVLVENSLGLLTLIASERKVSRADLCNWSLRSAKEIDRELEWATDEGLVASRRGKPVEAVGALHLTQEGACRVLVNWIARHGGASTDQVSNRFAFSRMHSSRLLEQARERELLRLSGTMNFEAPLYTPTEHGLSLLQRPDLWVLALASREEGHLRACVEVAIMLEKEYGPRGAHGLHWELWGEREVLSYNKGKREENRIASPSYHAGGKRRHGRPDLVQVQRVRDSTQIVVNAHEVELTRKGHAWLTGLFWAYMCCETVNEVIYHTSSLARGGVELALKEARLRVEREIDAGNLARKEVSKFTVLGLPDAFVPAQRRARFYKPQPLRGADAEYQAAIASSESPGELELRLLELVQWVTLRGIVTPGIVERRLDGGSPLSGTELLRLAHGAGWLHHSDFLRSEGPLFYATVEGIKKVGREPAVYGIDYTDSGHYLSSVALCRFSRIAGELEQELPNRRVRSRWELRADCVFNGSELFAVATRAEGLGDSRHPAALITDPGAPVAAPSGAVVIAARTQASVVKLIVKRWWESKKVGKTYFYLEDASALKAATALVRELGIESEAIIRELPVSSREGKPIEDKEPLAGCSSPLGSRTARTNT